MAKARKIFIRDPSLRSTALSYLSKLPFTRKVADTFIDLLDKTEIYDDITKFAFIESLVHWKTPFNNSGKLFVREIAKRIQNHRSPFEWYCYIFFLAKYGEAHDVLTVAGQVKVYKTTEPFFARQRIAVLSRGIGINDRTVLSQWKEEISTGSTDAASVANNLLGFVNKKFPKHRDREYFYLFPRTPQDPYPIAKFLLLCVIAYNERKAGMKIKRSEVIEHVKDPWFIHFLKLIHPPWF